MSRDDIKIIEFGMEDEPQPKRHTAEPGIKIVEFDNDLRQASPHVVTGNDVGHIKIIEFGDDAAKSPPSKASNPKRAARAIKIVEFDDEPTTATAPHAAPKIKIMEFD